MGRVHEVLHWANRRAVAEEVTRRGYRVSGETLNRWVREGKEFPAVVERIVFDLFTITPDTTREPPLWAEALHEDVPAIRQTVDELAAEVGVLRAMLEASAVSSGLPGDDPEGDPSAARHERRRGQ